ncbi:hypothetical protein E2C01_074986 [Portunus trituberculatus]|uniref:Uncharacterized protein n=1 Tax=Portunus trituberculatus TaxID=210409 RepID=A0A5B7IFQ4_PORTR|nr:hypothetical protein [Portunus trituberculatus]
MARTVRKRWDILSWPRVWMGLSLPPPRAALPPPAQTGVRGGSVGGSSSCRPRLGT